MTDFTGKPTDLWKDPLFIALEPQTKFLVMYLLDGPIGRNESKTLDKTFLSKALGWPYEYTARAISFLIMDEVLVLLDGDIYSNEIQVEFANKNWLPQPDGSGE